MAGDIHIDKENTHVGVVGCGQHSLCRRSDWALMQPFLANVRATLISREEGTLSYWWRDSVSHVYAYTCKTASFWQIKVLNRIYEEMQALRASHWSKLISREWQNIVLHHKDNPRFRFAFWRLVKWVLMWYLTCFMVWNMCINYHMFWCIVFVCLQPSTGLLSRTQL